MPNGVTRVEIRQLRMRLKQLRIGLANVRLVDESIGEERRSLDNELATSNGRGHIELLEPPR
jgi:hypothetical protein